MPILTTRTCEPRVINMSELYNSTLALIAAFIQRLVPSWSDPRRRGCGGCGGRSCLYNTTVQQEVLPRTARSGTAAQPNLVVRWCHSSAITTALQQCLPPPGAAHLSPISLISQPILSASHWLVSQNCWLLIGSRRSFLVLLVTPGCA